MDTTLHNEYDLNDHVIHNETEVRVMLNTYGDVLYGVRATRHFTAVDDAPMQPASSWSYELKINPPDGKSYKGTALVADDGSISYLTWYKIGQRETKVAFEVVKPYADLIMAYILSTAGQAQLLYESIRNHCNEQAQLKARIDYLETIAQRMNAELMTHGGAYDFTAVMPADEE